MRGLGQFVAILAVGCIAVWCEISGGMNCRAHLDRWAAANGYELLSVTRRWMTMSWFLRSKAQRVYEIEVRDAQGRRHRGMAKVGGYFLGSLTNQVDVRWS